MTMHSNRQTGAKSVVILGPMQSTQPRPSDTVINLISEEGGCPDHSNRCLAAMGKTS
jgi:hypothetical protein